MRLKLNLTINKLKSNKKHSFLIYGNCEITQGYISILWAVHKSYYFFLIKMMKENYTLYQNSNNIDKSNIKAQDSGKKSLKVCHCVPVFSELTQTFIYELVQNLVSFNLDVHVLTWQRKNIQFRPFDCVHTVSPPKKWEIWQLRLARLWPEILGGACLPLTPFEWEVCQTLMNANIDLAHIHMGPTAVMLARACRLVGIPFVVTFRGRDASYKLRKLHWRLLYRNTLQQATAITYVSSEIGNNLKSLLPKNIEHRLIRVGKRFDRLNYRSPSKPQGRLITIGRLIEKKGHIDAIRVLARVREAGIDATLNIIGDGPLYDKIEQEVNLHNLHRHINLLGPQSFEETILYLENSDILLAPHKTSCSGDREGIPNTIKEAQFIGVPVVTTRHAGIPEAIPLEQHDFLCEEGAVDAMADRVIQLLKTDENQLKVVTSSAREHVEHTFDPIKEAKEYLTLYQDIISNI